MANNNLITFRDVVQSSIIRLTNKLITDKIQLIRVVHNLTTYGDVEQSLSDSGGLKSVNGYGYCMKLN